MRLSAVLEEGFELLRWSVLAASTIGPGTVIVCSKAGADYALTLLWALVLASFVAYALQEGAARLRHRRQTASMELERRRSRRSLLVRSSVSSVSTSPFAATPRQASFTRRGARGVSGRLPEPPSI